MSLTRALLLDRDGVINVDGYVGAISEFKFMPGIFDFLRAVTDKGYRLAVVTNQSGVARQYYAEQDYYAVTEHMLAAFRREGVVIDVALGCFEHPDAVDPAYKRQSFWYKPNPGMVLEAIRRMRIDPARSAMLGDRVRDMQAAQGGGIATCLWLDNSETEVPSGVTRVRTYDEALRALSV